MIDRLRPSRFSLPGGSRPAIVGAAAVTTAISNCAEQAIRGEHRSRVSRGRSVTVEAKPGPFVLNTQQTAVIVVDMQNDFGSKGGMLDLGGADISGIQKTISRIALVLAAARRSGLPVVYLKMGFRPDLSDLGPDEAPNRTRHLYAGAGKEVQAPDGSRGRILVRNTWNTEIVRDLKPEPNDAVLYKTRFSGFYKTKLNATLRRSGIKELVMTGCTTSVCVESTLRDAMFRDYRCVLLEDCTAEPIGNDFSRSNYQATLLLVETLFGWVSTSSELLRAMKS